MNDNNDNELHQTILSNYNEWLNDEELDNTDENIDNYVIGLHYDISDEIDKIRELYNVPKELEEVEAIEFIENYIENLLKDKLKGEKMTKQDRISSIEKIYNKMQEDIINDIGRDEELNSLWKELTKLEEELNNTLSAPDKTIFDEYLHKEAEIIDCERKKAFKYGYNLSNKLMIDSLRE